MARPGPRAERTPGPVTIGDVADAAQVSRATVSRVMNGRTTVDEQIAARVQEVATRLGYQPSAVARSLSLGRTETVALVVPDLGNPMFQQILQGVTSAAAEDGYRVLVADTQEHPTDEAAIVAEARRRCDAVLLVSPRMPDEALAALLPRLRPAVLVNREVPGTTSLSVDYAQGMTTVVDHLAALGHTDLVYLAGPEGSAPDLLRRAALVAAVAAHPGLSVTSLEHGHTVADGYRCGDDVLTTRATAAVCFNDLVAFGLLARLNETGVAIPDDLSVTGFDDIELARYATPSLTTVAVPLVELGHQAWRRLHDAIQGATDGGSLRVEGHLQPRASTGAAPRRPGTGTPEAPARPDGVPVVGGTGRAVPHAAPRTPTRTAPGRNPRLAWHRDVDALALDADDLPLAQYRDGRRMSSVHSPRPYLHPVHTLDGVPLTDMNPVDHRHHHGVSLAVADVNGTSFWGGRTYVRDLGPTLLSNHGTQDGPGARPDPDDAAVLLDDLTWRDHDGQPLLTERRRLRAALLPDHHAWTIAWDSELVADQGDLVLTSPVASGRAGAGYGGVFWRLSATQHTSVFSEAGEGERATHGSRSGWVAYAQEHRGTWTTLVLTTRMPGLPWFARADAFPGAGPCLSWDAPLRVDAGGSLRADLLAVLVDRRLSSAEAATLADVARDTGR